VTTAAWVGLGLALAGSGFFVAGTVGLFRFPDLHSRLHALTKADNLGLGLVATGLAMQAGSPALVVKLAATWVLALAASSTSAYLIAERAHRRGAESADGDERR
jgi:multicomponent Na+:H+ antiporter subunit G